MKHVNFIVLLFLIVPIFCWAEIKVDLDVSGRNSSEVTEPGYSAWVPTSSNTFTSSGVTFKLSSAASSGELSTVWYKLGVQAPNYARMVCDAAYIKDCTTNDASLLLEISGLSAGTHTLLTYHNAIDDYSSNTLCNMDIYVNNSKVVTALTPTKRALSIFDAKTAYLTFTVTAGQTVKIKFAPNKSTSANVYNVYLNGFALDVPNSNDQARTPNPADADCHVNCDGTNACKLSWTAASNAVSHNVYFGTSESAVSSATKSSLEFKVNQTSTSYNVSNLYVLNTYYWRIDEVASNGTVTKGNVWSFRPRRLAFPEAEGYGKYATGGRGGKVVYVTNLNDSGKGSFREAMTNDIGPRTIVFAVSGRIILQSRLVQVGNYVTIAGQTAPGRGICVSTNPVGITGSETIFRFLRVRLGSGETADGFGMTGGQHSISDHCSVGWTIDEAFSSRGGKNLTLQRTLISEALNIAGHKNYPVGTGHGYAATIGGDIGSFHHNLLAHNQGRNWSMGGGLDGDGYYAGRLDVFNNVVYNWWHRVTDGGAHEVNFVGNYYKRGAASEESNMDFMLKADLEGTGKGSQAYYYHNNIMAHKDGSFIYDGTDDSKGRKYTLSNGQVLDWNVWNSQPFFESQATVESARNAYKSVLSDVGCTMPVLDNHDARMVNETLNGTYSCTGSKSMVGGIIDGSEESKEGDYSYYTSSSRPSGFDSDWDGLPDWWEKMIGTNANSASSDFSDSNADPDKDGYTNLENYLYWMATPHVEGTLGVSQTIVLDNYFKGFSKTSPSYSVAENVSGLTISINSGKLIVSTAKSGVYYFKVKVKDSQNDVMTRTFGIYAEGVMKETTATLNKCGIGSSSQNISLGESIDSFCYSWTEATSVHVVGLPAGVSADVDVENKIVTIKGIPTEAGTFNFTVITIGATNNATKTGAITVTRDPATLIYESETTDFWTSLEKWSPSMTITSVDTAIIRTGEVKVASTPDVAYVKVEENGTFRITAADIAVDGIKLQGGTIKSYTSSPLFTLTSVVEVEENSSIMVGSVETSVFEMKGSLTGSNNLEKTSVGTLKLSTDGSGFEGFWILTEGTIQVSNATALGTKGVTVSAGATLDVDVAATTGDLTMVTGSKLNLDADLTVSSAMLGGVKLVKGIYTSADYPDFIFGSGNLIVLEETTELKTANFETLTVAIAPNPSDGETNVYMRFFKKTNCHLFVLDQRGTLISEMTASLESGETMLPLRLENITSGVYILKIVIDEDVLVNELIVK
ncbi:MAG: hypothetical protein M0P12_09265 [Paludibacteraceae bacterium]|nr:hypothetical protein [Paludibacteraceae bacterium]